jgi:hypothetical protein
MQSLAASAPCVRLKGGGIIDGKETMTAKLRGKLSKRRTERDDSAERNRLEKALEIGLEDTFPASDAVAAVQPTAMT